MREILQKIQIHVPFHLLRGKMMQRVVRDRINPEIGFNHHDLDRFRAGEFREVADRLVDSGLSVTFHAPFMDLRPGALDPRIRQVSVDRLRQLFDLVPWFRPRSVVCHASFDERYYINTEATWLENSLETWRTLLGSVRGTATVIAIENVYERDPGQMKPLLVALASPQVRFCFDAGHANAFGYAPLGRWIEVLGEYLCEIHIHDNHGTTDEHLPVGEGNIPFPELFSLLRRKRVRPILTVEAHSGEGLERTLKNIRDQGLLDGF